MPWGIWWPLTAVTFIATLRAHERCSALAIWGTYYGFWSAADLLFRDYAAALIFATISVVFWWIWWRRHKRKAIERVLGVVRDLGHRLTVVNVPAHDPS